MTGRCVIRAISSQYLEFVGNVPSAQTMTCVLFATIVTNIICGIGFSGLTHLEVKGLYADGHYIGVPSISVCCLSTVYGCPHHILLTLLFPVFMLT